MKFSLFYNEPNCETAFINLVGQHPHELANPGEMTNFFSLISREYHGGCHGVRFFKVRTKDRGEFDDFFDRSLFGISRHYNSWIFEILFVRILIS